MFSVMKAREKRAPQKIFGVNKRNKVVIRFFKYLFG